MSEITVKEAKEYIKCSEDIFYFIKNYVYFLTPHGKEKAHLNDEQYKLLKNILGESYIEHDHERFRGTTTALCCYALHTMIFKYSQNIGLMSYKHQESARMLRIIKDMYSLIPSYMQHPIVQNNVTEFMTENHSRIKTFSSNSHHNVRGMAFNVLFLDDFYTYKNGDQILYDIIPAVGYQSKVVVVK